MTSTEMHRRFEIRVQKINSNAFDDILPEEIDEYLNDAVFRFIKDRLVPQSNILQRGFEQSIKRLEDLRELVKKNQSVETTEATVFPAIGNYFADNADFPADYMYLLSVRFNIEYSRQGVSFTSSAGHRAVDGVEGTDYKTKVVRGRYAQQDDIYKLLEDPHNTTKPNYPLYDVNENGVDVYTDDTFIANDIIFTYLREPATIELGVTDCDLSESVHPEIVAMAARLALGDINELGPAERIETLRDVE